MEIFVSYEDWPFTQRLVAQLGQFIGGTIFIDSTGIDLYPISVYTLAHRGYAFAARASIASRERTEPT